MVPVSRGVRSTAPAVLMLALATSAPLAQPAPAMPAVDPDDIGGVVTGPSGPEAGVWVIAETRDLPTRFIKAVVTDEQGRFVVPDLPAGAAYEVWARGYGLADSEKTRLQPGRTAAIQVRPARDAAEAAKVYPAAYWYSMLPIPPESAFSGATRDPAFPDGLTSRRQWLNQMKSNGCVGCHQMGTLATRTIPAALGRFDSSEDAWVRRVQSGQAGPEMINALTGETFGGAPIKYFAAWTDRIAKGETPKARPQRPTGVERNVVVTIREWHTPKQYLHDLISTDRRFPTVNGYGPLYGSPELSTDLLPILDPKTNVATQWKAPVRDPRTPVAPRETPLQPSPYWGDEAIWDSRVNSHNPMLDRTGRVWLTAAVRGPDNPAFCKRGSTHPSARAFPVERASRHLAVWEPKSGKYSFVDTCFSTHHLQFDAQDRLWTSGGGPVVGWLDAKVFDATGDAEKAQGWTPLVLDTNGNGRRDDFVEPNQPVDPTKDKRVVAGFYAVMPSPADGSVWGTHRNGMGGVVRIAPGADPANTALAEIYNVPLPGYGVRGGDIDSQGVVWVSLASGHMGSFDRRKCRAPLNGPTATGAHCPEGWSFFRLPGPAFEDGPDESIESSYYLWVDQHDTLGLGKDVPIVTGNLFDGFHALVGGRMVTLRTPYPLGFYAKGLDGRIDDASAGWKGRGLWSASGDRTPWHMEGGKGSRPLAVHMQVRPDPLAH